VGVDMGKDNVKIKISHSDPDEVDRYLDLLQSHTVKVKSPKKKDKYYNAYAELENLSNNACNEK
jgi:hypothetical protein